MRKLCLVLCFAQIATVGAQNHYFTFESEGLIPTGRFGSSGSGIYSPDGYASLGSGFQLSYTFTLKTNWGIRFGYRQTSFLSGLMEFKQHITDTAGDNIFVSVSSLPWNLRTPYVGIVRNIDLGKSFAIQPHLLIGYTYSELPEVRMTVHNTTDTTSYPYMLGSEYFGASTHSISFDLGTRVNWYVTNRFYVHASLSYFYTQAVYNAVTAYDFPPTSRRDIQIHQYITSVNYGIGLGLKL
ncbi:MAG: hypothetical protein WC760_04165 [Bacteroidia bacterium]|jgi:hypothetical protein